MRFVVILLAIVMLEGAKTSLTLIDEAYDSGKITKEEWLNLRKLSLTDPEKLPEEYRGLPEPCGTQILLTHWRETGNILLARPSLSGPEETIETTHFIIHYTLSGSDATTTSYANNVANFAEQNWTEQVDNLGWDAPPADYGMGGDNRYDIYILNLGYGIGGYTQAEYTGPDPNQEDATSYIAVNINLSTNLLKVVVAHEFNHACQFSYSYNEETWWMENCATWMEDVIYDNVNDYVNYLYTSPNPLEDPYLSIKDATNLNEYAGCIWPMFIHEFYDIDAPRRMWDRMGTHLGNNTLSDINYILSNYYSSDLMTALKYYGVWRYFTGSRADSYHFSEASLWPTSFILRTHSSYPASGDEGSYPLDAPGGTSFIKFNPATGSLVVNFDGEDGWIWGCFLIGYRTSGPPDEIEIPLNLYNGTGTDTLAFSGYNHIALVPTVANWTSTPNNLTFNYTANIVNLIPDITIIPDTVEIFDTDTGYFYVRNDGNGELQVYNIYPVMASWIVGVNPTAFTLAPSDSQLITIQLDTTGLDTLNMGYVVVESNDPDEFNKLVYVMLHLSTISCGDINGDGGVNTADLSYLANYLFFAGPPPVSMWAADVNGDGAINTADLSYLANYLFFAGPQPNCP
jgi:hypothetical protein